MSAPDVGILRAPMGGAWAWPLTPAGTQTLFEFFDEEPNELPVPIGGEGGFARGYIVEPYQAGDLAEHLHLCNCAWRVE